MSFGYLIITKNPCSVLTQTRGESFSLIEEKPSLNIYFRFNESHFYTRRIDERETVITDKGMDFFRCVYKANQGRFLFADILLLNHEDVADFAKIALKQLAEKSVKVIQAEEGLKINLRQAYFIEVNDVGG